MGDFVLIGSFTLSPASLRRTVVSGCAAMGLLFGLCAVAPTAKADPGPFSSFPGKWSGGGTVRHGDGSTERIRCAATYRVRGGYGVDLHLRCASGTYGFDLAGQFQADASNAISGRWSEMSRNIGGTAIGRARGDHLQLHVESSAFSANVGIVTRGRNQSVTINSFGGGQNVKASITLRRS